jgi:hypothetical protein
MEDRTKSELTPAQEDPAIHRMLSTLPAWMPGPGFDNRVLARVWRPHPLWLRRVEGYWGELVETGQVWLIVGAFALGSLIPIIALTALVAANTAAIGAFLGWLVAEGIPVAWAEVSAFISGIVSTVNTLASALLPNARALMVAVVAYLVLLASCAWGLYRTMSTASATRSSLHDRH